MAVQKQLYHMFNYWIHFSKFSNRKKSGSQSFPWLQNHFPGTELVIIVSYSVNLSRIIVLVGLHAKITLPKTAFIWFDKKHFIVINVIITCKQIMLCIKKTNPTSFFRYLPWNRFTSNFVAFSVDTSVALSFHIGINMISSAIWC